MKSFSLSRVAQYARYHYVTESRSYVWNWLSMFGLPLLFAIMSRDASTVMALSVVCYAVSAFVVPLRTINPLRTRGKNVLAMSLPVSNEERWVFMLFDLAVVMPLVICVTMVLATLCASFFDPGCSVEALLNEEFDYIFAFESYVAMQIVASLSLLVGLLSRRIALTYSLLFLGFVLFLRVIVFFLETFDWESLYTITIEVDSQTVETILKAVFGLIPVLLYGFSYLALRRRQMKW